MNINTYINTYNKFKDMGYDDRADNILHNLITYEIFNFNKNVIMSDDKINTFLYRPMINNVKFRNFIYGISNGTFKMEMSMEEIGEVVNDFVKLGFLPS